MNLAASVTNIINHNYKNNIGETPPSIGTGHKSILVM